MLARPIVQRMTLTMQNMRGILMEWNQNHGWKAVQKKNNVWKTDLEMLLFASDFEMFLFAIWFGNVIFGIWFGNVTFCIWFGNVTFCNLIWKCSFLQSDATKLLSCLYFDLLEPGHHLLIWSFQLDWISFWKWSYQTMCIEYVHFLRERTFSRRKKIFIDWKVWIKIIGLATNLMIILLAKEIHFKTKSLWRI